MNNIREYFIYKNLLNNKISIFLKNANEIDRFLIILQNCLISFNYDDYKLTNESKRKKIISAYIDDVINPLLDDYPNDCYVLLGNDYYCRCSNECFEDVTCLNFSDIDISVDYKLPDPNWCINLPYDKLERQAKIDSINKFYNINLEICPNDEALTTTPECEIKSRQPFSHQVPFDFFIGSEITKDEIVKKIIQSTPNFGINEVPKTDKPKKTKLFNF